MFSFLKSLLSSKNPDADVARNLFEALATQGGPGNDSPNFPDAESLNMRMEAWPRFAQKRQQLLGAMLMVSAIIVRQKTDEQVDPVVSELAKLLQSELSEGGVLMLDGLEVGNWAFAEVEGLLERPREWSKNWLREFYDAPALALEQAPVWSEHCTKQLKVMKLVIEEHG